MRIPDIVKNPLASIRRRRASAVRAKYLKSIGSPKEVSYPRTEVLDRGYYSQDGQDLFLAEVIFPGLRNATFVDVGANDGVTFSNTNYFEQHRGWDGLALEPLPSTFQKLRNSRKCECLQLCATESRGSQSFTAVEGDGEMLSGLTSSFDQRHLHRIQHYASTEHLTVDCVPLANLLADRGITKIDYMSIDTEGSELSVLRGIDWSACEFTAITVENNYFDPRIYDFLHTKGFVCHARFAADELYLSSRYTSPPIDRHPAYHDNRRPS